MTTVASHVVGNVIYENSYILMYYVLAMSLNGVSGYRRFSLSFDVTVKNYNCEFHDTRKITLVFHIPASLHSVFRHDHSLHGIAWTITKRSASCLGTVHCEF